jgi:hypothetical protein
MTSHTTTPLLPQSEIETEEYLFDNWFDPIEAGLRDRTRDFLQTMFEAELDEVLARSRYCRRAKPPSDSEVAPAVTGHRHGHRSRARHPSHVPPPPPSWAAVYVMADTHGRSCDCGRRWSPSRLRDSTDR